MASVAVDIVCELGQLPQPEVAGCVEGSLEQLFGGLQEVVILTSAFVMGWFLFRPLMSLTLSKATPAATKVSNAYESKTGCCSVCLEEECPTDTHAVKDVTSTTQADDFFRGEEHHLDPRSEAPLEDLQRDTDSANERCLLDGEQAQGNEACDDFNNFESAFQLARSKVQRPGQTVPGQAAHLALARWLARRQDLASANNCVESVLRSGGSVDLQTLRTLIIANARSGNMEKAGSYLQAILQDDSQDPGFEVFSAMVCGLCLTGQAEEAMHHLKMMLERGLRPDATLFDMLLESCAGRNMLGLAEEVLSIMQELHVQLSNSTLAAQIRLYSSRGELSRAFAVFEEMPKKSGFEPNAYVHGVLISACFIHGRADLALKTYDSMIAAGCSPNAKTYECLLRSCLRIGDLLRAVVLVDEALCLNRPPAGEQSEFHPNRTFIEPKAVEELLVLIGRRRQAGSLGLPLLQRLEAANYEISETLAEATVRAAEKEALAAAAVRPMRCAAFDEWRSFPSALCQVEA
mmetsp:Transcript_69239/g.122490  ORF Transcript_69239/g.122490 Transcript_69239/m.122490 type:complete len:519 (-) Transcript_69239:65-1621(-)|eukprot:CAMPEP_0197624264 /NCGR_PEP_ID=MMETSP1338-20131121/3972_1 /TAXON_ID=43686 ORGANISM="Pelagodinium beii, Strain RCC1491" /NCGR_SAMPLE_ID=MMETSP1338 /ASSEMBLY_ACC=CAM_ASM_000754 /LENGTH=518 /DNA_ID=CAMNT_0043194375 /DNA_START=197 /DNA_END=1753 /DNA_ORIENTATION=+